MVPKACSELKDFLLFAVDDQICTSFASARAACAASILDRRRRVQNGYIAFRERNFDLVRLQRVPQRQEHGTADIGQPAGWVPDPETQDEINGTVAKTCQVTNRRRRGRDAID